MVTLSTAMFCESKIDNNKTTKTVVYWTFQHALLLTQQSPHAFSPKMNDRSCDFVVASHSALVGYTGANPKCRTGPPHQA